MDISRSKLIECVDSGGSVVSDILGLYLLSYELMRSGKQGRKKWTGEVMDDRTVEDN